MKTLFIDVKADIRISIPKKHIETLPKKIGLVTTIQYLDTLENVKQQLEKNSIEVTVPKGKHTKYPGQMLGCEINTITNEDVDAFLYIGDGMFHPKALLFKSKKPVFVYNPLEESFTKLDHSLIEKLEKKAKGAYVKFLSSENVGVLVTVKSGQNNIRHARKLKEKYKDKNFYIFITDTLDFSQLEQFPFVECWINTMCPRIALDDSIRVSKPILNIEELDKDWKF